MELGGQTALVTGGSRGLGRAIAIELAKRGAKVAINYQKNEESARAVLEEIRSSGGEAIIIQASVGEEAQVEAMFQQLEEKFQNRLDILVNNAGITKDRLLLRLKTEDFDEVLRTNLRGTFLCLKMAGRMMLQHRYGRVVTVSSITGLTGNIGQAAYAASKAGMIALTKTFAREFARYDITANIVAPGFFQTDMTATLNQEVKGKILEQIPKGRMGNPEEIAYLVAFLVSKQCSYITGQVFSSNGGMLM